MSCIPRKYFNGAMSEKPNTRLSGRYSGCKTQDIQDVRIEFTQSLRALHGLISQNLKILVSVS